MGSSSPSDQIHRGGRVQVATVPMPHRGTTAWSRHRPLINRPLRPLQKGQARHKAAAWSPSGSDGIARLRGTTGRGRGTGAGSRPCLPPPGPWGPGQGAPKSRSRSPGLSPVSIGPGASNLLEQFLIKGICLCQRCLTVGTSPYVATFSTMGLREPTKIGTSLGSGQRSGLLCVALPSARPLPPSHGVADGDGQWEKGRVRRRRKGQSAGWARTFFYSTTAPCVCSNLPPTSLFCSTRRCFPSVGGDWSSSSPHSAGSRHRSPSAFATEMSRLRCRLSTVMSLVSFPIHHVGTPSIKPTALTYLGARAVQRKPKLKGWSHRPNPEDIKVRGVPVSSCPASLTSAARGACALKTWSTCNHRGLRPFHLQLVLARPNGLLANMA